MSVIRTDYGKTNGGEEVYLYTLENKNGMSAEIITYGGIVRSLKVKDKNGADTDVVLGRDTLEDYFENDGYIGAFIGRHANRIKGASFVLNGEKFEVGRNEGKNSLHGGICGFDKKVWDATPLDEEEPKLILSGISPDGEEGFPGEVKLSVTYTLTNDNALKIEYYGISDKDTVLNLTNHSYFNLNGYDSGKIDNQRIKINSSFYTPNDEECMPTGEVRRVEGTAFDFRKIKEFGGAINSEDEQVKLFGGIDHNYAISGRGLREAAYAVGDKTGIGMSVYTNQGGMQLYTANGLPEGIYKNGSKCGVHTAFCLETQCFPNSMEHSHFPGAILKKGEEYNHITIYKFDIAE